MSKRKYPPHLRRVHKITVTLTDAEWYLLTRQAKGRSMHPAALSRELLVDRLLYYQHFQWEKLE